MLVVTRIAIVSSSFYDETVLLNRIINERIQHGVQGGQQLTRRLIGFLELHHAGRLIVQVHAGHALAVVRLLQKLDIVVVQNNTVVSWSVARTWLMLVKYSWNVPVK